MLIAHDESSPVAYLLCVGLFTSTSRVLADPLTLFHLLSQLSHQRHVCYDCKRGYVLRVTRPWVVMAPNGSQIL